MYLFPPCVCGLYFIDVQSFFLKLIVLSLNLVIGCAITVAHFSECAPKLRRLRAGTAGRRPLSIFSPHHLLPAPLRLNFINETLSTDWIHLTNTAYPPNVPLCSAVGKVQKGGIFNFSFSLIACSQTWLCSMRIANTLICPLREAFDIT